MHVRAEIADLHLKGNDVIFSANCVFFKIKVLNNYEVRKMYRNHFQIVSLFPKGTSIHVRFVGEYSIALEIWKGTRSSTQVKCLFCGQCLTNLFAYHPA